MYSRFLLILIVGVMSSLAQQRLPPGVPPQQYQQQQVHQAQMQHQQQLAMQQQQAKLQQQQQMAMQQQQAQMAMQPQVGSVPQQVHQQVPQQMQQVPQQIQQVPQQIQQVPQQIHQQVPHQVPVHQVPHQQPAFQAHHPGQGHQGNPQLLGAHHSAQEREHMKEHMAVPIDTSNMSEQELQFHYFKMHDADNNNKLDGCELVKSLIHWHDSANHDPRAGTNIPEPKIFTDAELNQMIDPILEQDDKNKDGFIDYPEFIQAQQGAAAAAVTRR